MDKKRTISKFNAEGYLDPTAHEAMTNVQKSEIEADDRASALIKVLKYMIQKSGFGCWQELKLRIQKRGGDTGEFTKEGKDRFINLCGKQDGKAGVGL